MAEKKYNLEPKENILSKIAWGIVVILLAAPFLITLILLTFSALAFVMVVLTFVALVYPFSNFKKKP